MSALVARCTRSLGRRVEVAARRSTVPAVAALILAALAAAPASAGAADTVVVPGAVAQRMAALDGVLVWTTGDGRTLMRRASDGSVGPVPGVPPASYRSIDLGHDASGDLVLTYLSCAAPKHCTAWSDDLAGHRTPITGLAPKRCELTAAPSVWRQRVAYVLNCSKLRGVPDVYDPARSGLFVRVGAGAAKHVGVPRRAQDADEARTVEDGRWVDLRDTHIGVSSSGGNFQGAYTQTVDGTHRRAVGHSWDEGTEPVPLTSMSLGAAGALWTLHDQYHEEAPRLAYLGRLASRCEEREVLTRPDGPTRSESPAASMAVDGDTVYLYVPGTGIVTHAFPADTCNAVDPVTAPTVPTTAPDPVVVPGVAARRMTALDGVVVWTTGAGNSDTLMRREASGRVGRVPGARTSSYRSIDLGRDSRGKLVLTYLRCTSTMRCTAWSDDLHGHRTRFRNLVPKRCELTAAPARWRDRVAYGLSCSKLGAKPDVHDAGRSGLFVRDGAGAAGHAGLSPRAAKAAGVTDDGLWFDLRGTRIAGSVSGPARVGAYTQTIGRAHPRFDLYSRDRAFETIGLESLSLGPPGLLWTLYGSRDTWPREALISRIGASCDDPDLADYQWLMNPVDHAQANRFPAESMAVDGDTIYLSVPGMGIVKHAFTAAGDCDG